MHFWAGVALQKQSTPASTVFTAESAPLVIEPAFAMPALSDVLLESAAKLFGAIKSAIPISMNRMKKIGFLTLRV